MNRSDQRDEDLQADEVREDADAYEADPIDDGDYRPWGAPAPVVTDEGVYGTLPDRQRVFREYERQERPWRDTLVRLAGMVFAVTGGLWLALFSASEATSEQVARPALESLVDTMVGLPGLLEVHATTIADADGDAEVPGYPLPITIPADDISEGPARWREVILDQTSALLYAEGPDAFGESEGGGTFSTAGGTRLLMSNLTESRHASFSFLVWPLGIAAVVAAIAIVAVGSAFLRFGALGLATATAAIPSIAVGAFAWAIVVFVGSDGSALAETGHAIATDLAWLPIRNGVTFLVAGLAIALAARVASAIFTARPAPVVHEELYEDYEA